MAMRRRRWITLVLGVAAVGAWLGLARPPAADAVGLSVLCPGDEVARLVPIPSSLVFEGDAITGEHVEHDTFPVQVFTGFDEDGSPALRPGALQGIDVGGDRRDDLMVGVGVRTSTAAEPVDDSTGPTPLDALLAENFAFPDDFVAEVTPPTPPPPPSEVEVLGLDLLVELPDDSWIRDVPDGHYAARFGFRFDRVDTKDRVVDHLEVVFDVDSLQAFARADTRFPDLVRMSIAEKRIPRADDPEQFYDDLAFWNVGQEVVYDGVAPGDLPPLDTGATVTKVTPVPDGPEGRSDLLDVDLAWDRVPEDFAVGVGQTCPSERPQPAAAHFATNIPKPAAEGHDVDIAVRSGIGAALDGADEVRVEGRVDGLPERLDLLERDGVVDLVRSTDRSPDIWLRRLDLAVPDLVEDDPRGPTAGDGDPIHAHGRLDGLPAHVRIGHDREPVSGDLTAVDLDACPEVAEDDLINFFLPWVQRDVASTGHLDGCIAPVDDPGAAKIRHAHLVVQNFLTDGRYAGAPSEDLRDAPPAEQQAERTYRYVQQGPDRPWRLTWTDAEVHERTAFLLVAAQHPRVGSPAEPDPDVLLVRAGADLRDIDSVTFRTEAGSRRPAGTDPHPDGSDRKEFGARDVTAVSARTADEPLVQVTAQLDRRDDLADAQANRGSRVDAHGTMVPFPGRVDDVTFESLGAGTRENVGDTAPLRLGWDLAQPTVVDLGELHVQLPGRDAAGEDQPAVAADGEAELTVPRAGAVALTAKDLDGRLRNELSYDIRRSGGSLRLRLAGRVTTEADRSFARALRIGADVRVEGPFDARLERIGGDRRLVEAAVTACTSAAGCDNDVRIDAVMGPDTSVPTLAQPLLLPSPAAPRPWVTRRQPEANDLTVDTAPASGEDWVASVRMRDLRHLAYLPLPGDICVRSGVTGPMTALLRTGDLWFDGRLGRVPDEARVRVAPDGGADGEPWIWLDTTSCTTDEPPVEATAPAAGPGPDGDDGPVLDATAVFSTGGDALAALPAPPPPSASATDDHLSAHVEAAADGSMAAAANVRQHVPDHLLIWRPVTECGQGGSVLDLLLDIAACTTPQWQHTDHQLVALRAQSTRPELGSLALRAHVVGLPTPEGQAGGEWTYRGTIADLPGSLAVGLAHRSNERLGWDDWFVDAEASTQIGEIGLEAQNEAPDRVGFSGDADGPNRMAVPEVQLALHDVGDELHVTARGRSAENVTRGPVVGDRAGEPICSGHTRRGVPGVAYVHADVELDGLGQFGQSSPAENLTVDLVNRPDDPRGHEQAARLVTIASDQPVDATVRTRLTNIAVSSSLTQPDVIGRGAPVIALLARGLPGALATALADIALEDPTFDMCLDFDLPLELELVDSTTSRLANEGAAFALDTDDGGDSNVELRVGELGGATPMAGIPFAHRSVRFDPGDYSGPFDESGGVHWKDTTAVQIDPGGESQIADCHNEDVAYQPGITDISTATMLTEPVSGTVADRDGAVTTVTLTRTTFALDLLYSSAKREALKDRDTDLNNWLGCPGTAIYRAMAASGTPPLDLPVGTTETVQPEDAEYTITQNDAQGATNFCTLDGWDTSVANRPETAGEPTFPEAVGPDGTRYTLHVWSRDPTQLSCRVNLVARHPDGAIRWTRPLGDNFSPLPWRGAEWEVRLFPDPDDGSVEMQVRQRDLTGGLNSEMLWVARLDAGGRGQIHFAQDANLGRVLRLLVGVERRMNPPDVALPGACTGTRLTAPAPASNVIRVWYFGEGSAVRDTATSLDHCYTRGGDYYAHYVDYRNGFAVGGSGWEVFAPSGTT